MTNPPEKSGKPQLTRRATEAVSPKPPDNGWPLEEAMKALVPEQFTAFVAAREHSRRWPSRLAWNARRGPDRGDAEHVIARCDRARRDDEEATATLWSAFRRVMEAGRYVALGRRGGVDGEERKIEARQWSALNGFDLGTSTVREIRRDGARYVAVYIFDAGGEQTRAPPREPSPYPDTEAGMVAAAFDQLRPNGKNPGERNDTLYAEIRAHLGLGGGRPSNSTIKEGITLSNTRHGRPQPTRGGDRKSAKARAKRDEGDAE